MGEAVGMRRLLALLSVLAVAACSSAPAESPAGDYHVYGSAEELVVASDLIVHGIVVDSRVELSAPPGTTPTDSATARGIDTATGTGTATGMGMGVGVGTGHGPVSAAPTVTGGPRIVVTVVTLTVIDVFKGEVAVGDEIEIDQVGGRYRGVDYVDPGTTLLQVGQPGGYVLLLRRGFHDAYYLPNPQQAMFTVSGEGDLTGIGRHALPIATTAELRRLAASP